MQGLAVPGAESSTILPAVEQRIGPKSQPLDAAAVNPAYIPGLTSPVSEKPKDEADPEEAVEVDAVEVDAFEADAEDAAEAEEPAPAPEETASAEETAPSEETASSEEEAAPDGPVFEAADRRAKIVADHRGVRLQLDDQNCEFRWDEIGAVETESPRFGKRFTITVHTPDRRWYPIEIEAKSRSQHTEWESRLDDVLDTYFEDEPSEQDNEPSEQEDSTK